MFFTEWIAPAGTNRTSPGLTLLPRALARAERLERRAQLDREQLRLLPRGEMAAPIHFVEVDQVLIRAAGPGLGRPIDVLWKYRDRHRQRELGRLPRGRLRGVASRIGR